MRDTPTTRGPLEAILSLVESDHYASAFQSLAQYRTALKEFIRPMAIPGALHLVGHPTAGATIFTIETHNPAAQVAGAEVEIPLIEPVHGWPMPITTEGFVAEVRKLRLAYAEAIMRAERAEKALAKMPQPPKPSRTLGERLREANTPTPFKKKLK